MNDQVKNKIFPNFPHNSSWLLLILSLFQVKRNEGKKKLNWIEYNKLWKLILLSYSFNELFRVYYTHLTLPNVTDSSHYNMKTALETNKRHFYKLQIWVFDTLNFLNAIFKAWAEVSAASPSYISIYYFYRQAAWFWMHYTHFPLLTKIK